MLLKNGLCITSCIGVGALAVSPGGAALGLRQVAAGPWIQVPRACAWWQEPGLRRQEAGGRATGPADELAAVQGSEPRQGASAWAWPASRGRRGAGTPGNNAFLRAEHLETARRNGLPANFNLCERLPLVVISKREEARDRKKLLSIFASWVPGHPLLG